MITGFNHVGVVVKNADEMAKIMEAQLGAAVTDRQIFEEANQLSVIVEIGTGAVEIMSPLRLGEGGTVDNYLQKSGGGLHHISLRAEDFDRDVENLENQGVKVFGKVEMQGRKIAFAHPKTTGGILYEILEPAKS